ncbi:MAG: YtxH domain-containing protein [Saprospiraceae bacterium]|nr:YtxH domain-containing protein [Saprospiraceae bacterium]
MKQSTKVGLGIGFGLIAGGLVGYYLNSDEGRVARRKTKKKIAKMEKQARKNLAQQSEQFSQKANEIIENARTSLSGMVTKANSAIETAGDKAEHFADEAAEGFKKGTRKAQATLQENAARAKAALENGIHS